MWCSYKEVSSDSPSCAWPLVCVSSRYWVDVRSNWAKMLFVIVFHCKMRPREVWVCRNIVSLWLQHHGRKRKGFGRYSFWPSNSKFLHQTLSRSKGNCFVALEVVASPVPGLNCRFLPWAVRSIWNPTSLRLNLSRELIFWWNIAAG